MQQYLLPLRRVKVRKDIKNIIVIIYINTALYIKVSVRSTEKVIKTLHNNKYKNVKIILDGISFDSKKEAQRYNELKSLQHTGEILDLKTHIKYILIPAVRESSHEKFIKGKNKGNFKKGRIIERECSYFADFVYIHDGKTIVEDAKGFRTKEYIIKRKLMLFVYGIKIKEV